MGTRAPSNSPTQHAGLYSSPPRSPGGKPQRLTARVKIASAPVFPTASFCRWGQIPICLSVCLCVCLSRQSARAVTPRAVTMATVQSEQCRRSACLLACTGCRFFRVHRQSFHFDTEDTGPFSRPEQTKRISDNLSCVPQIYFPTEGRRHVAACRNAALRLRGWSVRFAMKPPKPPKPLKPAGPLW